MATTKAVRGRSRDEILSDTLSVLRSDVSGGMRRLVADNLCWGWTEADGKYVGCRFWTAAAAESFARFRVAGLRHEHAVPRRVVIRLLLDHPPKTTAGLRRFCERLLIGVVVTAEEDRQLNHWCQSGMPAEFFDAESPLFGNPWLRFAAADLLDELTYPAFADRPPTATPSLQKMLLAALRTRL